MKCIYIAGAYSAVNVITTLDNMRRGIRLSTEVLLAGFAPFCPWLDHHYQLMLRDNERLTIGDYYAYSISWLRKSEAVLLVPGWENSKGVAMELLIAGQLNIPVYYSLAELVKHEK